MSWLKAKQTTEQVALAIVKQFADEVLDHRFSTANDFTLPPQEFYDEVEQAVVALKLPGLEISRQEYSEGGLLSAKRVYLRFIRERLAFDVCAFQFGTRYFFSCRTIYSPPRVRLWHFLAVGLVFGLAFAGLDRLLGATLAGVALAGLLVALIFMFRNLVAMQLNDLDGLLLKIPALGPIYERFFRVDSYYRKDTRLMFLETIPPVVEQVVDEITLRKGCKLVRKYQSAPVLGELYQPLPPRQPDATQ
jgi:hypothetical protein